MLFRRQKTNYLLLTAVFCTFKLIQSQTPMRVSQLHLPRKKYTQIHKVLFLKQEFGDCESNSQRSKYHDSLETLFLIWFYRCWANENTIKTKNVRGALWLRMPKRAPVLFYFPLYVSFSSFLMNECQNIELDELLFIFIVLYIEMSF